MTLVERAGAPHARPQPKRTEPPHTTHLVYNEITVQSNG